MTVYDDVTQKPGRGGGVGQGATTELIANPTIRRSTSMLLTWHTSLLYISCYLPLDIYLPASAWTGIGNDTDTHSSYRSRSATYLQHGLRRVTANVNFVRLSLPRE